MFQKGSERKVNNQNHKNKSGEPFRGDLKAFRKTALEKNSRLIQSLDTIPLDFLETLRTNAKDATASRCEFATKRSNKYQKIKKTSQAIIFNKLKAVNPTGYSASFVSCIINTYNGSPSSVAINDPRCKSPDPIKATKHAWLDCNVAYKAYIEPVKERIIRQQMIKKKYSDSIVKKYLDIESAMDFFGYYIYCLYGDTFPNSLSKETFDLAYELDPKIAEHYLFNSFSGEYYLINSKNTKFSSVSQECATMIICNTYVFEN